MDGNNLALGDLNAPIVDEYVKHTLLPFDGRPAHRAHQYTINGVTWEFVKHYHFASVPEPSTRRRQDMLAALMMARPGDLFYFFEADPHFYGDIYSRRGLRGIFRSISMPFLGSVDFVHPDPRYDGYKLLARCPGCGGTQTGLPRKEENSDNFSSNCDNDDCGMPMPRHNINGVEYPEIVMPWRVSLEPVIIFNSPVSDERAYSDMEDPGTLWVGRHDNQSSGTGRPGKGSSIRQLSPEEAVKLTRLLRTDPWQTCIFPEPYGYSENNEIPLKIKVDRGAGAAGYIVTNEFDICLALAQQFDNINSSFTRALGIQDEMVNIEYASFLYPWGYTAGQTDFLMTFAEGASRYKIIVIEAKREKVSDRAVLDGAILQVSMYIPWVVQRLMRDVFVPPKTLEIVPVVIGNSIYRSRGNTYTVAKPKRYSDSYTFPDGKKINVVVDSPIYLRYEVESRDGNCGDSVVFFNETHRIPFTIDWKPQHGISTDNTLKDWIRENSWQEAREKAQEAIDHQPRLIDGV